MLQVVALLLAGLVMLAQPVAFAQQSSPPVAPATPAPRYRLALTGSASVGMSAWGTELSGISDIGVRVQLLPWLGVGFSYLSLSTSNNEGYDPFRLNALEASVAWRPVVGRWFDPFVEAGVLRVIRVMGYLATETAPRFALEGIAGLDFVPFPSSAKRLRFAVGAHARTRFGDRSWTMMGLHLELRV